jgi:hypothetical protein
MRNKLLLALLLLSARAFCQQKVFEVFLDSTVPSSLHAFPVIDSDSGQILLTLTSTYTLQRYRLSLSDTGFAEYPAPFDTLTVGGRRERKASLLSLYDHYLASLPLQGGMEEAFFSESENTVRFVKTVYGQGRAYQTDSIPLGKGEYLFAAFYKDAEFYGLTAMKGSDDIRIWHRHPDGKTVLVRKTVPVKDWGDNSFRGNVRVRTLIDLARDITVVSNEPGTYPPLIPMLHKSKLYVAGDKVYITYDNLRLETHVIDLPLDDRPARVLNCNPADWYGKEPSPGFSNGNSFIFDSTLIVAAIVHLQLYMAIYDLPGGRLRKTFAPDANGQPGFAHSPAWQVGDLWKKDKVHRTSMAELYHNSFNFWTFGITGRHSGDNRMELEIGTTYDRGSIGKAMLGLGALAVAAAGVLPAIMFIRPGVGHANTMYFKAQFGTDSMQPLAYVPFDDKSQLIDNFAVAKKAAPNGSFVLGREGTLWYGYLDAEEGKYLIYKF